MPKVTVNRDSHRALIEENWWDGELGYDKVDVHCKVYRCDGGPYKGKYSADAHIHRPGGGYPMVFAGAPNLDGRAWANSRDEAVEEALRRLEARDDVRL